MNDHLAILSFSETFYTTRRLLEVGAALGLEVWRLDPLRVIWRTEGGETALYEEARRLPVPQFCIPRVGTRLSEWGLALVESLSLAGVSLPVTADGLRLAADKLRTTQVLAASGLPVLPTVGVREPAHIDDAIAAVGGAPVVLKLRWGTQGATVQLAPDEQSARSALGMLIALGHTVLVQPFVHEQSPPADVRVLVVGGEPVAACERRATSGEFRANVHRGAIVQALNLDSARGVELAGLAQRASEALGLAICGVDLILSPQGWVVLEINGSPGLEGIEKATGRDLATVMVRSVLQGCATNSA